LQQKKYNLLKLNADTITIFILGEQYLRKW